MSLYGRRVDPFRRWREPDTVKSGNRPIPNLDGCRLPNAMKKGIPMADEIVVTWPGASGKTYKYYAYRIGHKLKAEAGNYIFARVNQNNQWEPVYIGETDDLDTRAATHEKRECARRNGATHILAHLTNGDRAVRLSAETDLRGNYKTPCNDQ